LEALVSGRSMLHGRNSRMPPTDDRLAESSYLERREIGPRECSKIPGSGSVGSIIAYRSWATLAAFVVSIGR
jgi:hypothetical protein